MDVLVTANNHSCDRGDTGIVRTIEVLDSLEIMHTGSFRDTAGRDSTNLLVLEKNNIRLGILNYTYGTNYIDAPPPTVVNYLDVPQIEIDIKFRKQCDVDQPGRYQKRRNRQ